MTRQQRKQELLKELESIKTEEKNEADHNWKVRQELLIKAAPYISTLIKHDSTVLKKGTNFCQREYDGCLKCMLETAYHAGYWVDEDWDIEITAIRRNDA